MSIPSMMIKRVSFMSCFPPIVEREHSQNCLRSSMATFEFESASFIVDSKYLPCVSISLSIFFGSVTFFIASSSSVIFTMCLSHAFFIFSLSASLANMIGLLSSYTMMMFSPGRFHLSVIHSIRGTYLPPLSPGI